MKDLEVVSGLCLLVAGAVPVGTVLLTGKLPPVTTFGPAGTWLCRSCIDSADLSSVVFTPDTN